MKSAPIETSISASGERSPSRFSHAVRAVPLLLGLALAACSSDSSTGGTGIVAPDPVTPVPTPPAPPARVASVTVLPSTNTPTVGDTLTARAELRSADGTILSGRAVTWRSSDTTVVTVDKSGLLRAIATGTASVTATSEGQSGSAELTVIAAPVDSASSAMRTSFASRKQ